MRLRFLGTGTSFGVPVVGCDCDTCASADPRDRRTRHAVLLEADDGRRLLVDTPPELRLQLIRERVDRIDAVWFTHEHADHTAGLDDLRVFTTRTGRTLPAWSDARCAEVLRARFAYVFDDAYRPPAGTTKPQIRLCRFESFQSLEIAGFPMLPLPVPHGDVTVHGFRTGDLGYLTDAGAVPDAVRDALRGVRVLVLSCLWYGRPHPTHMTVEQAIDVARDLGAERTLLTHLTHRLRHAELAESLPAGIEPAYDGLAIPL